MHLKKSLLIFTQIFSLSVGAVGVSASLEENNSEEASAITIAPKKLYDRVWKIIKSDFVDQHYNHQDWEIWRHRYDEYLETKEDSNKAIETMIASLGDRYTRFLDKKAFDEEKESIEAELTGVGIQIGLDKTGRVVVIAPIEGTPGALADLRPNDIILEIVPIKAIPDGQAKMLFDDIAYIRLSTFISKDTVEELIEAIEKLKDAKGYIIDLRNNPGGLLNNAMIISDMFLSDGVIVSTVSKNGYINSYTARSVDGVSKDKPVILLVNSNSASASEIFSGALRDNGRAEIVGTKTFGKGLVQAINKLGDGSGVNVTIAKYLTPNKTDINQKGIDPDYEVKLEKLDYDLSRGPWFFDPNVEFGKRVPEDGQDKQLMKAVEVLKDKFKDPNPISQELKDKIAKLDEEYKVKLEEQKKKGETSEETPHELFDAAIHSVAGDCSV